MAAQLTENGPIWFGKELAAWWRQRWKDGQSLSEIARALGKHPGSIHGVVKANGGIVPATKTRAARSLTTAEREEISRGLAQGDSMR